MILFLIYLFLGIEIKIKDWMIYIFDLQGFLGYLYGAEHLWFLSVLALCYLITPILDYLRTHSSAKVNVILFLLMVCFQVFSTYCIAKQMGNFLFYINLYIVAYIMGANKYECKTGIHFSLAVLMIIIGAIFRLIGKIIIDGTITYDVMVVDVTQSMIAFGLLFIFQFLFDHKVNRIVKWFDKISFEVYLVHYMFVIGPISLMNITKSYLVNCLFVVICSLGLACLVNGISIYSSKK